MGLEKHKKLIMKLAAKKKGMVSLVGAGPGHAKYITVKAKELIDSADIVAYDALISASLLASIPSNVKLLAIGYRGYGSSKLGYGLHPKVIEYALAGKNVVRLKSGDPFIFGRGSQECLALKELGIRYQIVPGVSSALAAAAHAGFPLTHRDYASDVVFACGHDLRGGSPSHSRWPAIAQTGGTIVIYMAASKIKENCLRLIQHGKNLNTPAIYIACASCGNEEIIEGSLNNLAEKTAHVDKKKQALIIVGDVVRSRALFSWRECLPLNQKRFLVARSRDQKSEIANMLENLGADVIELPHIKTSSKFISFKNEDLSSTIIFSSRRSVQGFFENLKNNFIDIRNLYKTQFYALDKLTYKASLNYGLLETVLLKGHCFNALKNIEKKQNFITVIGGGNGREQLMKDLNLLKMPSSFISVYQKKISYPPIALPPFDGLIFCSSSSVDALVEGPWKNELINFKAFCIGDHTFKRASCYFAQCLQSNEDTRESLLDLILLEKTNNLLLHKMSSF